MKIKRQLSLPLFIKKALPFLTKQLNDTVWEQELKEALRHFLQADRKGTKDFKINALWRHFDQINDRLMVLFDLLHWKSKYKQAIHIFYSVSSLVLNIIFLTTK